MLKLRQNKVSLVAGAGLCILLVGAPFLVSKSDAWLTASTQSQTQEQLALTSPKSDVFSLVSLPPEKRMAQLQEIAQSSSSSEDRDRARYLLASDLIQLRQGEKALKWLDNLEQDYPALAAYVALKRAQAYELTSNNSAQNWQNLIEKYPNHPVAAQALFVLGRTEPKYWQQAITQFPNHPRTWDIARLLLKENPNQPQLLLLLAKYDYKQQGTASILDKLANSYSSSLKSGDWEAIALVHWENRDYGKAAIAYAKAPRNPRNIYRLGRSLQLSNKKPQAEAVYKMLNRTFPNAEETGTALMHLAKMAKRQQAIGYLNQAIGRFPDQAGAALAEKAAILDALNSKQSAAKTRQLLLTKYGDAEEAAEYRWKQALIASEANDYRSAWTWAEPIPKRNPTSILAPRASFWIGKWAQKLGRMQDAQTAFEYVLSQFPQSYYAWRSAVSLGLDVGNFNNIRALTPEVVPSRRTLLPAGSDTLKELYLLGQDRDAWQLWQVEFANNQKPTVAQQFTNGVMQLAKGENLLGIAQISTLEDRSKPQEQVEYQALSRQLPYWQARYPFPYLQEILTWSQQRQLNPLLVTALIRQESRFEPKIRSIAGATGLMQVMPSTGAWIAQKINLKQYNQENPNDNILLGTWFLDYTHKKYNNNSLLAVASYNAGTANVSKWLSKLSKSDPDEFVEAIPFDETQGYVRQVFGNYWNYLRLYNPETSQLVSQYSVDHPKPLAFNKEP